MSDIFETTVRQYEAVAAELETAVKHMRLTAGHFRAREVPRGCAHTLAATGHLHNARAGLADLAAQHAAKSTAE